MVSNMQFLPYMAQLMCYMFKKLENVVSRRMFKLFEERNCKDLLDLSKPSTYFAIETLVDREESSLCLCLLFLEPKKWNEVKYKKLQQLLRAAWRSHLLDDEENGMLVNTENPEHYITMELFGYHHKYALENPLSESNFREVFTELMDFMASKSEVFSQPMFIMPSGEVKKMYAPEDFWACYKDHKKDFVLRFEMDPDGLSLLRPWWQFWYLIDEIHKVFHRLPEGSVAPKEGDYNAAFEIVFQNLLHRHEEIYIEMSETTLKGFRAVTSEDNPSQTPFEYLKIAELDPDAKPELWVRRCLGMEGEFPE